MIVIRIRRGMVEAVYAKPGEEVTIFDFDELYDNASPEAEQRMDEEEAALVEQHGLVKAL